VCGGGGAHLRQSHVYMSDSNSVEIVLMQTADNQANFLIKSQGNITYLRYIWESIMYYYKV